LDGNPWSGPPSIGCEEVNESNPTGPLSLSLTGWPQVAAGGTMPLAASITGRAAGLQWNFGDGVIVSNTGTGTLHVWTNAGNYTVTATIFNQDNPQGIVASLPVQVLPLAAPVLAVSVQPGMLLSLQFSGQPGLTYELQSATNLAPPTVWQPLQTLSSTGQVMTLSAPSPSGYTCFYRLQVQ
jgi:hypothetical protein